MEVEDPEHCSCGVACGDKHRWTARERTVIARMVQYLNESYSMKMDIEEFEHCLLGVRGRHQAYCDERKGQKASKAFPDPQCAWSG